MGSGTRKPYAEGQRASAASSAPAWPLGSQRSHPHRPPLAYEHTYIDILIGWSHPVAQTLTSWCLAAQKTTHLVLRAFAAHHHRRPTTTAQCTDTPQRPPRPPPAVRTCSRVYGRRLERAARVARGDLTRLHENVLNRQSAALIRHDGHLSLCPGECKKLLSSYRLLVLAGCY